MKHAIAILLLLTAGCTVADKCAVKPADRNDCGWFGIDNSTCADRGCCWDESHDNTAWCFYPTDSKCYGIDPNNRKDCGYYGIQREECEDDKGCCFDHTVSKVPWCFHGKQAASAPPTESPTEPPTESPTAEKPTADENESA